MKRLTTAALAAVLLSGAAASAFAATAGGKAAVAKIDAKRLSEHDRVLSSDEFEGRGPATAGEQKAIDYIAKQFAASKGLEPGGPNGSWFQDVTLYRFQKDGPVTMSFNINGQTRPVEYLTDAVVGTQQPVARQTLKDAPLVFVGYGVHAPERNWDDFKGVDLKGKVMVVLVNDPDFEDPSLNTFNGKAMTYYGRWTYKFEEAARQGAAGVLIVHETKPAAYGWNTVKNSWSAPQFDIVRADMMKAHPPVQGWIQRDLAVELFSKAGLDFEKLKVAARSRDFQPVELKGESFSADFAVKADKIVSHNVIARLPGKTRPDESIVYGAHWDHLGVATPQADGDAIYNGALDNASGVAGLIELSRVFAAGPRPDRSVVFIAYTAEEKGLLGSEYYAANPVFPLEKTVAAFNMDGLNVNGPARNVTIVGWNQDDLQDDLIKAAKKQGRVVQAEEHPESGSFYRSDHFSFAKRGVPVLYSDSGEDLVKGGVAAGKAAGEDYVAKRYHQPDDEWNPNWDWSGAVQDVTLIYDIGRDLASSTRWPQWKDGSEFKAEREKSADVRH
jgi:Zn-dependent M28 family amino/carboxypeptidase